MKFGLLKQTTKPLVPDSNSDEVEITFEKLKKYKLVGY